MTNALPHRDVQLEFGSLITDASSSLLAASHEGLPRVIEDILEKVRVFFRADRCALLAVSPDLARVNVRCA